VLKVDLENSGAEESLTIKLDSLKAVDAVSHARDPARRGCFFDDVGRMIEKCETDMEAKHERAVNDKPVLIVSSKAESYIATIFEHKTCCYKAVVDELYRAITKVLTYWTDGDLGGSNDEIHVKISKPPKKLMHWRHCFQTDSPGSPDLDDHPIHSNPNFDPLAILHLKTSQILSLEPAKLESFREWLKSSDVRGAKELLAVLNVQKELEQQRDDLQRKIYNARRTRASMFGLFGTLLFDLMHGGETGSFSK